MQTFLPYREFRKCAFALDDKRLGKQRVETLQILNALRKPNYGWKNHPAVRMWVGHEYLLTIYGRAMCLEWIRRGFQDTCLLKFDDISNEIIAAGLPPDGHDMTPWWLSDERLTTSHRSNLIRKLPEHYRPLFPGVPDDLPYFWPTKEERLAA